MVKISIRGQLLKPSPTLKMAAKANELKSQGYKVINFTVGEPDWTTFESAKKGGISAIEKNFTKYTPASGYLDLKTKLCPFLSEELGLNRKPANIAIGPGAKYLIYTSFQLILNPEDEVLIPSPYWVSYPTMVELSGGYPKTIPTQEKNKFKLTPHELESHITDKTKCLVLCSPNNPTGTFYTQEELLGLAKILKKYPNIWILSDDIYNRLLLSDLKSAPHILQVAPDLEERTICIGGASKSFAMTGWRIGWLSAPSHFVNLVSDFLSQTTSNPSSISQMALHSVLDNFESELKIARETLNKRSFVIEKALSDPKLPISFVKPDGAFYYFIKIDEFLNKKNSLGLNITNSLEFAEELLNKAHVATVAGSDFGQEGWLRISYANPESEITEGIDKIRNFIFSILDKKI